jgi:hypothetical protein
MTLFRSRRALLAFLLALALPFALVACGSDDGDDEGGSQAQETPAEEESTPAEETGDPQLIHVVATEYMFEGVPETLEAGSYQFHLQNDGKEPHEFALAQIVSDAAVEDLLKLDEKALMKEIKPVGATFAEPGGASEQPFDAELEPGRYAAVCFVPVQGKKNGPPHAFKGMVHEFTVE